MCVCVSVVSARTQYHHWPSSRANGTHSSRVKTHTAHTVVSKASELGDFRAEKGGLKKHIQHEDTLKTHVYYAWRWWCRVEMVCVGVTRPFNVGVRFCIRRQCFHFFVFFLLLLLLLTALQTNLHTSARTFRHHRRRRRLCCFALCACTVTQDDRPHAKNALMPIHCATRARGGHSYLKMRKHGKWAIVAGQPGPNMQRADNPHRHQKNINDEFGKICVRVCTTSG